MNNDLNSALALFQSLYKAQKGDVYTIIERFILVGVKSKGLVSFTKEDLAQLLKETFNIDIPFSVIQKCIISYQDVFKYTHGKYVVINSMDEEIDKIISDIQEIELYKESIIAEVISYFETNKNIVLSEEEKSIVSHLFFDFLIDKEKREDNELCLPITQFIIEKEHDIDFQRFINSIREGMVIYKGIRYSDSPNDSSWESNTDFFLDVEYLFSACGLNGSFYEKCFHDFYNYVVEINNVSRMKGGRDRIRLFYFHETKREIDVYFAQAIRIRRMQERYSYPKVAMDYILNSCKEDIDIERFKTNFYSKLKGLHIEEYQEDIDLKRNQDYLIENDEFEKAKDRCFQIEQRDEVNSYIRIADYISILREGKSGYPLEKCKQMFLSDGNLSNELSRFIRDYYNDRKPLFITRMGNFTELMWFKLRKGVVDTNSIATISVVNKAKTIVSSLLHDNLKRQYHAVLESGDDENTKKAFYAELRTRRFSPEDINSDTIVDDIAFIDETDYLEKYKETQELLKGQALRSEALETELQREKAENEILLAKVRGYEELLTIEKRNLYNKAYNNARKKIFIFRCFIKYFIVIANVFVILLFVFPSIFCMNFTWLNIIAVMGFILAVLSIMNPFIRKLNIERWFRKRYKKVLSRIIENS